MTANFNISVLNSHIPSATQNGNRKGFRSSNRNNWMVEVVDLDGELVTINVEARTAGEASEKAQAFAAADGVQVSYCNVYQLL